MSRTLLLSFTPFKRRPLRTTAFKKGYPHVTSFDLSLLPGLFRRLLRDTGNTDCSKLEGRSIETRQNANSLFFLCSGFGRISSSYCLSSNMAKYDDDDDYATGLRSSRITSPIRSSSSGMAAATLLSAARFVLLLLFLVIGSRGRRLAFIFLFELR